MEIYNINDYVKGWLIGDFEPSLVRTADFEFALKYYRAGDKEAAHVHKIAREITVAVSGVYSMNGRRFSAGEIIDLQPGEPASFECLEDGAMAVIKLPSAKDDKYFVNSN
jgi:hypothetical protein